MLTAELAASSAVLLYCIYYHNYRQHILILFWKYLFETRLETWLNLFWEDRNGKLFAVVFFYIVYYFTVIDSGFRR
jgi:hypothetical protein